MVALRGDHRFGDRDDLVGGGEADDIAEPRIGLGIAVGRAHAAANADVVAQQAGRRRGSR
jgi:hypothetical protein